VSPAPHDLHAPPTVSFFLAIQRVKAAHFEAAHYARLYTDEKRTKIRHGTKIRGKLKINNIVEINYDIQKEPKKSE
jgi:hypothetical protein